MSSENIRDLVEKAKKGDKEAFGDLYEMHSRAMYSFACRYLGDSYLAEDAVSDTAVNAFISIKSLKKNDKFKSWLFTILIRCCKKQLKSVITLRNTLDIDSLSEKSGDSSIELHAEINGALEVLGEEEKEILLFSVLGNLTSKEIGEIMSMPPGTIRSKISRATDKLYIALSERSVAK